MGNKQKKKENDEAPTSAVPPVQLVGCSAVNVDRCEIACCALRALRLRERKGEQDERAAVCCCAVRCLREGPRARLERLGGGGLERRLGLECLGRRESDALSVAIEHGVELAHEHIAEN